MKALSLNISTLFLFLLTCSACTTIVTAPIEVAGSVAEAGIGMVGAAGEAVVDIASAGKEEDEE